MAIPDAPLEGQGSKVLFGVYDNAGTNAAALLRAIAQATVNLEVLGHLAVASQVDGQAHGASAPLVMIGGSDGTTTRKALVDSSGRFLVDLADLPAAALLSDAVGNPTTTVIGSAEMRWTGGAFQRARTPSVFKNFNAQVITAEATIWTPTTGAKFRLMGYCITQGVVTGAITVKDGTAGPTILTIPQSPVGTPFHVSLGDGILSAAANNLLRVIGASTETISGFVYGTEE